MGCDVRMGCICYIHHMADASGVYAEQAEGEGGWGLDFGFKAGGAARPFAIGFGEGISVDGELKGIAVGQFPVTMRGKLVVQDMPGSILEID